MLTSFCNDTVTRVRPSTTTSRGSTIFDWDNATAVSISGCSMQPATTSLSTEGRGVGIQVEWTLFAPPEADIQAGDRIVYEGKTYIIQGDVRVQPSALNLRHLHITLRRYSG